MSDAQRRFVRTFQPRFARLVKDGAKKQTIRRVPKRMPRPGDILDAREWTGSPYRSPQRKLGEFSITDVCPCHLAEYGICMKPPNGSMLQVLSVPIMTFEWVDADRFAKDDGFVNWEEMRDWFGETHGFPFEGIVIYWRNP